MEEVYSGEYFKLKVVNRLVDQILKLIKRLVSDRDKTNVRMLADARLLSIKQN